MKNIERVLLVWLALTFITAIGVVFFPFKILIADDQLKIERQIVYKPGDIVNYSSYSCKRFPIKGTVNKVLKPIVNPFDTTYSLDVYSSNSPAVCTDFKASMTLPRNIPSGEYEIELTVSYFPFRAFWPQKYTALIQVENTEEFNIIR